jgi:hypothetical protein
LIYHGSALACANGLTCAAIFETPMWLMFEDEAATHSEKTFLIMNDKLLQTLNTS